ncbi:serine--tRNA ligase [Myxococcota bacterium]|nr:serine--tRNA ligase [Myxococcota bacterium]
MLDFRMVGADLDRYRQLLSRRPSFDLAILDDVKRLYEERSVAIREKQELETKRNAANTEMQRIMKSGTNDEKQKARDEMKDLSNRVKALDGTVTEIEDALTKRMLDIPNVPHESVPDGADEAANVVVRTWGDKPTLTFTPKDHVALGVDSLGLFDFERATKITGARFVVEYGALAQMERALAAFMIDVHTSENGYTEVAVPYLVNTTALTGTGQLPKFEADQFKVPFSENVDYYLVPTAEVPVTNLYADEILEAEDMPLPRAFCCYTACFRKEAGAAGRDTRGIIRQHQFNKVELVRFVEPERSYEELELLVSHAEKILQKLGLHYRVVKLCAGDMSSNAAKCYDLEVWLPGQDRYREISSCSNFEDFQARRAKIRFKKDKKAKAQLVHTLNGSGLAVGRTLVAILEQYQDADGGVRIPEALRPYMGGRARIEPKKKA